MKRFLQTYRARRALALHKKRRVATMGAEIERLQREFEAIVAGEGAAEIEEPKLSSIIDKVEILENRKNYFEQLPLANQITKFGIDMNPDHYKSSRQSYNPVLTKHGENYARRTISALRLERAKSIVAIFMPVLSALIAILGLVVALRRGK